MIGRTPQRIRLSRAKGWRLPKGAVSVARPTKWGNPFRVRPTMVCDGVSLPGMTPEQAVLSYRRLMSRMFTAWPITRDYIDAHLRGRDLACWCALDQPCHADVLLELANAPLPHEAASG